VNEVRARGTCGERADERNLEYARALCEARARQLPAGCEAAFDAMYTCASQQAGTCGGPGCGTEQRDYAECASAGTCTTVGGGSFRSADANHHADIFTTHELCRCVEGWETGAPGDDCDTHEDCSTVCCTCPGSTMQYTASACDKSATGGTGVGRCASAEAACALSADRCL
jgi:hypothetical protein